ncbi:MAG: transposase, partial [Chthoniobacter sp.]|nr:transposase [Chthoniobacter sp.]
ASCHSRLRDEFLNREVFASALEAKVLGQQHRQRHNHERPHSSLDYQTQHGCALPLNSPSTHNPKTNRNSHSKWIKNRGQANHRWNRSSTRPTSPARPPCWCGRAATIRAPPVPCSVRGSHSCGLDRTS